MKDRPFYFELQDLLIQFIAAFDDVTIARHDKNRTEKELIKVRYIHAPKQRVLYDIVNKAQNITLPVISINVNSLQRDESRVFNKIMGFDNIGMPVPVNVSVSMNIIAAFQSDLDQIVSNFVPYNNPYVIISWKIPEQFGLGATKEIRSEVLWDGNISYEYPIDLDSMQKTRFIASTSFIIKGWLFPAVPIDTQKQIYFINANFRTASKLSLDYSTLTGENYNYDSTKGLLNETEYVRVSGVPIITNLYKSTSSGAIDLSYDSYAVQQPPLYNNDFIIIGEGLDWTKNILLSSNTVSVSGQSLTAINYTYYPTISGYLLSENNFNVLNDTTIYLNLPTLSGSGKFDIILSDKVGWSTSKSISAEITF